MKSKITLALLVLISQSAAGDDWSVYTTDNFTLYSDTTETDAREVLLNFESFRSAALTVLGLPDVPESERLIIIAFDRGRDFNPIKGSSNVIGFFYHSVFGPRMIVGPGGDRDDTQITLFHEYVHHLMNQHATLNYPRWYSEGFATLLSTADISESSTNIGNAPPGYLRAARLDFDSNVAAVIDLRPDGVVGSFYVTSWLMTHYLLLDAENAPLRRASLLEYLARFDAGEDPTEAFVASFDIFPGEFHREIEAYARRGALTVITLPPAPYAGELRRRALVDGEDLYRLGDIAVERNAYDAAYEYFDEFEEQYPDSAFRFNVDSRRAIAYVHEDRIDEGDALMAELLSMEISDGDALADIAHYAYDRYVEERENSSDLASSYLNRAINYGVRAIEANPDDVEALYYLGHAYEADGRLQLAVDALFKSHDINPSATALNIALARVLIKGQQPEVASYLLSRLYSASHSEATRTRISDIQQAIEDGTVDLSDLGGL